MFAAKMPPTRLSLATIRPLRYELTGRRLPQYARSHSCRSATFSRPACLASSRLFASVSSCYVSKSVANPPSHKRNHTALREMLATQGGRSPALSTTSPVAAACAVRDEATMPVSLRRFVSLRHLT